ncbi:hypothetical protein EGY31_10645 [Burkholderia multivorans]|uniref:hypothetical protein n=1 Tax=Burkholderia ubonensis TaxID=101571 RepID=UPI000F6C5F7D|nr:hypothetical protein [Burkholderia ubonensis]AYZ63622.1 hypothetical protein EGY31_10645 [Burkholderia multivorans]
MIPVSLAAEPADFDAEVRQAGLSAIDELVGRPPRVKRSGRRRKKIADSESKIPSDKFPPFWRRALDDMLDVYDRRCAYLSMYIHHATGSPTVDHVLPKSFAWNLVYEWSNYRLCAAIVNAKKNDLLTLVDPFRVRRGWFELNLVTYRVQRGASAPRTQWSKIDATLPVLNLRDCCKEREEYLYRYQLGPANGGIDLTYLEHRAPFIASELRRQGQLRAGDV